MSERQPLQRMYCSLSTLSFLLDIGESTIEAWVAQGTFPPPKKIGPTGMRRWSWKEVQEFFEGPEANAADVELRRARDATRQLVQGTEIRKRN